MGPLYWPLGCKTSCLPVLILFNVNVDEEEVEDCEDGWEEDEVDSEDSSSSEMVSSLEDDEEDKKL